YVVARLNEVQALVAQARANPASSLPTSARTPTRQGSNQRQFQILVKRYLDIVSRDRTNLVILMAQAPILAFILLVLVLGKQSLFTQPRMDNFGNVKIVLFLLSLFSLMCG